MSENIIMISVSNHNHNVTNNSIAVEDTEQGTRVQIGKVKKATFNV